MDLIALVDCRWGIAKDGRQICTIPDDLKRFKALTMGSPIVLGRKTLLNFPDGKPLPGRENYILSKKIGTMDGATVCRDVSEIPEKVLKNGWCAGGESVYRQLLPYCDRAYITFVYENFNADQFCPNIASSGQWELSRIGKLMHYGRTKYQFFEYRKDKDGQGYEKKRPRNPYREGSYIWLIMEGALQGEYEPGRPGWEDLSSDAIAEVLSTSKFTVRSAIRSIRNDTGYVVQYTPERGGPVVENKFPERLKFLVRREQRHRKKVAIAELCGLDQKTIRRYEQGKREPGLTELISLADHFGVSIDYMVGLTDNPFRNP